MKKFVDAFSVANTVRMVRSASKHKTAVLVEGDKDIRVYANNFDSERCFITPAGDKLNAVGALRILKRGDVKGVLAIIDADFSLIIGPAWNDPDIVITDSHDLEGILLRSPALEKLLVEYGMDPHWGAELRPKLLLATRSLAYLRMSSQQGRQKINFDSLDFRQFIDPVAIRCDIEQMAREAVLKSTNSRMSASEMLQAINDLNNEKHDPWMLSCGHDMTCTLAVVFGHRLGRDVASYTLERQLRLAFEKAFFVRTKLHKEILEWEARNPPFRVLRS